MAQHAIVRALVLGKARYEGAQRPTHEMGQNDWQRQVVVPLLLLWMAFPLGYLLVPTKAGCELTWQRNNAHTASSIDIDPNIDLALGLEAFLAAVARFG